MHDPDAEVSGRVGLARDLLVAILLDVRVVHPGQGYIETAGGEPPPLIVEIQPAGRAHVIANFSQGRSGPFGTCQRELGPRRYRVGLTGSGAYRSFEPSTKTPGRLSSGPRESMKCRTDSGCAMESPVLTTMWGSRSSRDRIQAMSRFRPGVRWASERCSTRNGSEPGARTGT